MYVSVGPLAVRCGSRDCLCYALQHRLPRSTRTDHIAVHVLALLHHPSKPVSTILIEQYRPPAEATVVEFPAGLVDEGEDPA